MKKKLEEKEVKKIEKVKNFKKWEENYKNLNKK